METRVMTAVSLTGEYVCAARGGCLHYPQTTITSDGVWVREKPGSQYVSAHRDCYEKWAEREKGGPVEHPLKTGDKVTHHSHRDQVGTVIAVEEDKYSWSDPIYHVVWAENGPAIPMRNHHHLKKVEDSASAS